jgi:hypothetical protein
LASIHPTITEGRDDRGREPVSVDEVDAWGQPAPAEAAPTPIVENDEGAQTPWAVEEGVPGAVVDSEPASPEGDDDLPFVELTLDRTSDAFAVTEPAQAIGEPPSPQQASVIGKSASPQAASATAEPSSPHAASVRDDEPAGSVVQRHLLPDELVLISPTPAAPQETTPDAEIAPADALVTSPPLSPEATPAIANFASAPNAIAVPTEASRVDEFDINVDAVPDDVVAVTAEVPAIAVGEPAPAVSTDPLWLGPAHDHRDEANSPAVANDDPATVVADADASTPAEEEELDADADEIDPEPELVGSGPVAGGMWTIPMLCLGVAIIACCILIPQADYNRRLVYEREKLRRDAEAITQQVKVNDDFLRKLADDPTLAERLAQRQMKIVRQGTRVLDLKSRGYEEAEMSPFHLVTVPPPDPLPPFQARGGALTQACLNPHTRLYLIGGALILMASGLVLGYAPRRG